MDLQTFKNRLKVLSETNKVFLYGASAIAGYLKKDFKFIRILTDLNITDIARVFPNIKFSKDYYFSCYLFLDDNTFISFYTKENNGTDDLFYLKNILLEENENPLLFFIYALQNDRFYILNEESHHEIKKSFLKINSLENLKIIDIFDLALCASELNVEIKIDDQISIEKFDAIDLKVYLSFLELILTSRHPYKAFIFLEKTGFLKLLFPFLKNLSGVTQDRALHPEGDVFEHTLHCFQFVKNPSLTLSFGLLLHDYGKAFTQKEFCEHSTIGETKVREVLKPYGYSESFIKDIEFLVGYHMVNSYFYRISDDEKLKIFGSRLGEDLLRLFKADTMGSVGKLDIYFDIISKLKKVNKNKLYHSKYLKRIFNESVV